MPSSGRRGRQGHRPAEGVHQHHVVPGTPEVPQAPPPRQQGEVTVTLAGRAGAFPVAEGSRSDMIARMASTVTNTAIDCADAYQLALFWSAVTGHPLHPEDGPGDDETEIMMPGGTALHSKEDPEPKPAKNRLPLCLRPNTSRDAEVERLLALGASLAVGHRKPVGWGWAVLADPNTPD